VVVNDLLTNPTINPPTPLALGAIAQNLVSALEGGILEKAPFGLERIDWDPETRTCSTIWDNAEISVPNGIPSISEASGLVYAATTIGPGGMVYQGTLNGMTRYVPSTAEAIPAASQAVARDAGLGAVTVAVAAALESLDAAVDALDAGEPHDAYVQAARDALIAL
jgi:hypothetical protein